MQLVQLGDGIKSNNLTNMIPLKIGEIKTNIPTSWDEITLRQYMDLGTYREDLNILRLLSILTGVEYRTLLNVNADSFDDRIIDSIEFIKTPLDIYTLEEKETLNWRGREIIIPDPSTHTIGQKLALQSKIRQLQETGEGSHAILVSYAIAIYLQPLIDKSEFDDSRIEEIRKDVLTLPLVVAYPVGSFFLDGWIMFLRSSASTSHPTQPMKRKGQGLPSYSLNFMSSTLLSSWLITILQNSMTC